MESVNKIFYRLDSDVAIVSLFFATAYLAGSKRFIKVFPTANRQGLMFAAATSSVGLKGSRHILDLEGLRRIEKGTPFYLVSRSILVSAVALFTTPLVAKMFGRKAKILAQDVDKFTLATTGIIIGTHCTRYLRPLKPGGDVKPQKIRDQKQRRIGDQISDLAKLIRVELPTVALEESFHRPGTSKEQSQRQGGIPSCPTDEQIDAAQKLKTVCLQGLGQLLYAGERCTGERCILTQNIKDFDLDEFLGHNVINLRTTEYQELFELDMQICPRVFVHNKGIEKKLRKLLLGYHNMHNACAYYTKRIFGRLLEAKREWKSLPEDTQLERVIKEGKIADLAERIKTTCTNFVDAHVACKDQTTGQLQTLAIETASCLAAAPQIIAATSIMEYTNQLAKAVVQKDDKDYSHQADLERQVQQKIPGKLGFKKLKIHEEIAHPVSDFRVRRVLDKVAVAFKPVDYLIGTLTQHSYHKLFPYMVKWYEETIFDPMCDQTPLKNIRPGYEDAYKSLQKAIGYNSDAEVSEIYNFTEEAKLFFLVQNCIVDPV